MRSRRRAFLRRINPELTQGPVPNRGTGTSRTRVLASFLFGEAMQTIRRFLADETGATAIEYGLIAAGIALAIIAVVNNLGSSLKLKFGSISTSLK